MELFENWRPFAVIRGFNFPFRLTENRIAVADLWNGNL
jgi:hypothetical protein